MVNIFCAYDEMVPIEKMVDNPRNPNKHPEKQIKMLAKVIEGNGWRVPIVVSRRSGFVVKGHGRLEAARWIGMDAVPVDWQDYDSEAEEYADMIADNRLAELSFIDNGMIKDLLQELDTGGNDLELTGYSMEEIEAMMTENADIKPEKPKSEETVCPKCGNRWVRNSED